MDLLHPIHCMLTCRLMLFQIPYRVFLFPFQYLNNNITTQNYLRTLIVSYYLPERFLKLSIIIILLIFNGSSLIVSSNLKRHIPCTSMKNSSGTESKAIKLLTSPTVPITLST